MAQAEQGGIRLPRSADSSARRVQAENQGVVSGFLNTAAQLGTALGVVAFVGIAAARTRALSKSLPAQQALLVGYPWAYLAAARMALAALLYAVLVRRDRAAA